MVLNAFLSYSTHDRHSAAILKQHLERAQISVFMAHDDIEVSEEWRIRLLKELRSSNIFICLLSQNYQNSIWCMQESGIAAYRKGLVVVPLTLDETMPPGFLSSFQTIRFDPEDVQLFPLGAAMLKADFPAGVEFLLNELRTSKGFRAGESNLKAILPHVPAMDDMQRAKLLMIAAHTHYVISANLCVSDYLPPLVRSYGHLVSPETLEMLRKACRL